LEQKEELEQKHLHLLQILDSERQSKWQYVQQTEELGQEVKKIRTEVCTNCTRLSFVKPGRVEPRTINLVFGASPLST
jgi:hypothetical protein